MRKLDIVICGGGNGACACAALQLKKGHQVSLFTAVPGEAEQIRTRLTKNGGLDATVRGERLEGLQVNVTDDPAVLSSAAVIFVIVPAFAHSTILEQISQHMQKDALVVIMPARGLLELDLEKYIPDANVIACQTLPWACRLNAEGTHVEIKGAKNGMQAATRPKDLSDVWFGIAEELIEMPFTRVKNMLTLTLSNIGQIFHPGIMYGLFRDDPNRTYAEEECPLFYQGVDQRSADTLEAVSREIHAIANELKKSNPDIELDKIETPTQWLLRSYAGQIEDESSLKTMLNTNKAYRGIKAPMVKLENGRYKPNFQARYITEDLPFSLLPTKYLGLQAGVDTPAIDQLIRETGAWIGCDFLGDIENAERLKKRSRLPLFY